ncbi:MAG: helix-turn-helix domain-containing protein [Ruminococcus sp.]
MSRDFAVKIRTKSIPVICQNSRNAYFPIDFSGFIWYNVTQTAEVSQMFRSRLKELREAKGYNMKQTASMLGIPYTTYVGYEKGEREPDSEKLIVLSDFFQCTVDYLLYRTDEPQVQAETAEETASLYDQFENIYPIKLKRFPLLGKIACGEPIYAEEDHESFVSADAEIRADFCLRASGDSMINAEIYDGDIVFIRKQPVVENGEIAAVIIEDEATLKRVYFDKAHERLQLIAENPAYAPLVYVGQELEYVRILGKAVALMRDL